MENNLDRLSIEEIIKKYPFAESFFEENNLDTEGFKDKTFIEFLKHFTDEEIEDMALDLNKLVIDFDEYIKQMKEFLGIQESSGVETLTILPGQDKSGNKEGFDVLEIKKSEMIAIVGPTGSGKSRLLADIEWAAQNDTPTKRTVLINGESPDKKWRFSSNNKLVAQLSQNMNFVMDLSVKDFLELHAKSRMVENIDETVDKIIKEANKLAGEQFNIDTQITALSGGQSRALMIADTAILSSSPIVLIDEIENAGIDRKKALDLLVSSDKIVLMATHDPTLALIADRRIVIKNGGIFNILDTSEDEKDKLEELEKMDKIIQEMRRALRSGEKL
ncbi:MAG: ATP-binding cassette domain-containing protein [Peptostreptococcus sp.]|uniref:ATP-binding cassette domain-containing protein n=1 Tax=Peptostreptococcus sp. TaxID=1262 RepID=UPI002FC69655